MFAIKNFNPVKYKTSRGFYSYNNSHYDEDLIWNHLDHGHRKTIHHTYQIEKIIKRTATEQKILYWYLRFFIPLPLGVIGSVVKRGVYLQRVSVLGYTLLFIRISLKNSQGKISWRVRTPRLLMFLHKKINKSLFELNKKQNFEDLAIREQRKQLRDKGYSFHRECLDFISANSVQENIIYPNVDEEIRLPNISVGQTTTIQFAVIPFILRRNSEDEYSIWPGICPHQGASLINAKIRDSKIKCDWHCQEVKAIKISKTQASVKFKNIQITLNLDSQTIHARTINE